MVNKRGKELVAEDKISINDIIVSLLFFCNSLPVIFGDREGIVGAFVVVSFFLLVFLNSSVILSHRYRIPFILLCFIVFLFILSYIIHPSTIVEKYFKSFIVYGLPFIFLPYSKFKLKNVFSICAFLALLCVPFYYKTDFAPYDLATEERAAILMTLSYRMLPIIILLICNGLYLGKNVFIKLYSFILAIVYLLLLLPISSRGTILALLFFAVVVYLHSSHSSGQLRKRAFLIVLVGILFFLCFNPFILWLDSILSQHDINLLFVMRMASKVNESSEYLGREEVYSTAFNEILGTAFLGGGIGSFNNYSGVYPHNVFLHLLIEGGLFFFIPFMAVLLRANKYLFSLKINEKYYLLLLFVISSGFIQLLFSFYFWGSQYFWMLIWAVLFKKEIIKNCC